jgi:biotin carboxyl carrier protein
MPENNVVERVRSLVLAFLDTDLMRVRIERDGGHVELRRRSRARPAVSRAAEEHDAPPVVQNIDAIKSDLVGIFHFVRPVPAVGEMVNADRELAYVEALGIRNSVRSRDSGRLASVCCDDGQPVEYGQTLFEVQRV